MLIKFSGYQIESIIEGPAVKERELRKMFTKIKDIGQFEGNLVPLFCRTYGYEEITYDDTFPVTFILDTDTSVIWRS